MKKPREAQKKRPGAFARRRKDSNELDLQAYFAPGQERGQIPADLDIVDRDLRVGRRAVWTVGVNAAGERWAAMDTAVKKMEGFTLEWAR